MRLRVSSVWRNRFVRVFYPGFFVVVFFLEFARGEGRSDPMGKRIIVAALAAGIPCVIGILVTVGAAFLGAFRKNAGVICEHEIQLADWGLVERTDVNDSVHRWTGIGRTLRSNGYLIIYTGEAQYLASPTSAFASAASLDAFEGELRQKMGMARK